MLTPQPAASSSVFAPVREQLKFSLHHVEEAPYNFLNIRDAQRSDWVISHILEGRVQVTTHGETSVLQSGDVMIHPPHLPFSEYSRIAGIHQWFAFEAQVWPQLDVLHQIPVSSAVTLRSPESYSARFRTFLDVWETPVAPARDLRLLSLTLELVSILIEDWQVAGAVSRPVVTSQQNERFAAVVNYMQANLEHKITRDDLARLVHLHPGYFDRAFRARYGTAPMQMLRDLRLRHAQHLLESTDDVLESVARRSGLGDAAHLSRVFRERLSQTPTEYRAGAKRTRESYLQSM